MVQLIVGSKGSGKTKRLLAMIEDAAKNSNGSVVCVEKGDALKFDLSSKIRLVDVDEYDVNGAESYYGFLAGLLAGNYDITDIFCDATYTMICEKNQKSPETLQAFITRVTELMKESKTNITFTVSCDAVDIPESLRHYVI